MHKDLKVDWGELRVIYVAGWHIASKPCENGVTGFLAWAKISPILGKGPLEEPYDHAVFFEFGNTRCQAIARLIKTLPAPTFRQRVAEWLRSLRGLVSQALALKRGAR